MSEWKEYKLGEITTEIGDGIHGTPNYSEDGDFYFINGNNISNGRVIIKDDTKRVDRTEFEKYKKPLSDRTILLSINGTIGNVAFYNNEKCILGKSACYFNLKENVDKHFVYYTFLAGDFQSHLLNIATGTTIQNVPLKGLRDSTILLPPLDEQKRIASILSSLDDKIDLLNRENATLEAMAGVLFKDTISNKENDGTLEQIISVQNGYAFKSKVFNGSGEHKIIKIKNISGSIVDIDTTDYVDISVIMMIPTKFKINSGDVLIAMTGAEIGKLGIIPQNDKSLWLNQRVGLLIEKFKGSRFLAYLQLKSDFGQDYIGNTATGSAQPNISGGGIERCEFPNLCRDDVIQISNQIGGIYDKIVFNLGQINYLKETRDCLLPKLMSNEIKL